MQAVHVQVVSVQVVLVRAEPVQVEHVHVVQVWAVQVQVVQVQVVLPVSYRNPWPASAAACGSGRLHFGPQRALPGPQSGPRSEPFVAVQAPVAQRLVLERL